MDGEERGGEERKGKGRERREGKREGKGGEGAGKGPVAFRHFSFYNLTTGCNI